jgi:membrane-bound metal-dependent hydrolase YbcI (DUF457 family)
MKGITHFAIGVAAASCFPQAVEAGAGGNPLYLVLGGFFGLLPDTLDFKFTRFFYKSDITITPDPNAPDAGMIANGVAMAVARAHTERCPVHVKLNTVQLGADRWQQYKVTFDVPGRRVHVRYGPTVDTGARPIPAIETAPARSEASLEASAPLACDIRLDYLATTNVDIFDGPVYRLEPTDDGRIRPVFIPWHRSWTHSFVIALLLALASTLIWDAVAGMIVFAAYAAHIMADQLGHLGSNLFAPFTKRRMGGMRLTHAMWPFPNFISVWASCVLVFWNLFRQSSAGGELLNPFRVLMTWILIPTLVFVFLQYKSKAVDAASHAGKGVSS